MDPIVNCGGRDLQRFGKATDRAAPFILPPNKKLVYYLRVGVHIRLKFAMHVVILICLLSVACILHYPFLITQIPTKTTMLLSEQQIKNALADLDRPTLPAIEYLTTITGVVENTNKAGTGKHLRLEHLIESPPQYKGNHLATFITTEHGNDKAVEMGRAILSRVAIACGLTSLETAGDLLLKQCVVATKHEERDGKIYTKIKGYRAPAKAQAPAPDPLKDQWIAAGGVVPSNPISNPQMYKSADKPFVEDNIPF